ncbi:MAG: hypothetical protein AB7O69_06155 [Burkholderiales bacterium]
MSTKFDKTPMCEVCGKKPAMSFSYFSQELPGKQWRFCCLCTDETETYYVKIDDFFSSAGSTVDWLAHLHKKSWVQWPEFMDMMHRFRKATESFNKI